MRTVANPPSRERELTSVNRKATKEDGTSLTQLLCIRQREEAPTSQREHVVAV